MATQATQLVQAGNSLLTDLVMEIKSGNLRRCESLGLTDSEIRLLNSLTIEDLHYLSQSPVSIITCQVHRENLRLLLAQAKEAQSQNQCIERCLALGASIELLNAWFGLSTLEVATRRRLSGIRPGAGRTIRLSDEQQTALWQRWHQAGAPDGESQAGLELMMLCAEEMAVPLTAVWNIVQEWLRAGVLTPRKQGESHAR